MPHSTIDLLIATIAAASVTALAATLISRVLASLREGGVVRRFLCRTVRTCLRLRATGAEHIPARGGVLILANHISYADAVAVQAAAGRTVRFLGTRKLLRHPIMRWVFRCFRVIPVDPVQPRDAIRRALRALRDGDCVCIFPEGHISEDGQLQPLHGGFELLARRSGATVVPARIDGLFGTVFGRGAGRAARLTAMGHSGAWVHFGPPVPGGILTRATAARLLGGNTRAARLGKPVWPKPPARPATRTAGKTQTTINP
ncbi:MAG: 1-acyl-sn-glycerol-3-phosphate acyltransferase [Opitutales bacterium]|nr:1-acyl-sn-glycerol-3-phosphate acyltransferase [Opitutales bacterium]